MRSRSQPNVDEEDDDDGAGVEVVGLHGIIDLPTTIVISVDTTWTAGVLRSVVAH